MFSILVPLYNTTLFMSGCLILMFICDFSFISEDFSYFSRYEFISFITVCCTYMLFDCNLKSIFDIYGKKIMEINLTVTRKIKKQNNPKVINLSEGKSVRF